MHDSPAQRPRLILASSSPYRRQLLERLRIPFDVVVPSIDETPYAGETPAATALRLAEAKARAVATREADAGAGGRTLVIGSDQVATFDGRQIGIGSYASPVHPGYGMLSEGSTPYAR